MIDLTQHQELVVRQQVEHLEAFTGFETENRYEILTPDGQSLLYAYEESGGMARVFLKTHRPLDIQVIEPDGRPILSVSRDFFWFLSHLHVSDGSGNHIGTLNRQFAVLKRRFTMTDSNDRPFGQITGSLFRPYTFFVQNSNNREIGRITKQWSGLLREGLTDADTFQVQFSDAERSHEFRLLLLASAFAIDLDFFEQ